MPWHPANLRFAPHGLPLVFALLAMAIFITGPQMGSLDLDGDGYPDTPIAVAGTTPSANTLSVRSGLDRPQRMNRANTTVVIAVLAHECGAEKFVCGLLPSHAPMQLSSVLRC